MLKEMEHKFGIQSAENKRLRENVRDFSVCLGHAFSFSWPKSFSISLEDVHVKNREPGFGEASGGLGKEDKYN